MEVYFAYDPWVLAEKFKNTIPVSVLDLLRVFFLFAIVWQRASRGKTASEPTQVSLPRLIKLLMSSSLTLTLSCPNYISMISTPITTNVWNWELYFQHMNFWGRCIQTMVLTKHRDMEFGEIFRNHGNWAFHKHLIGARHVRDTSESCDDSYMLYLTHKRSLKLRKSCGSSITW